MDAGETNPTLADTDADGWIDPEEIECMTNPARAKSVPVDGHASGVCDGAEADGDGDGWSDGVEALCGTDPANAGETPRTDALGDYDGDGIINCLDGIAATDGGSDGGGGGGVSCGASSVPATEGWVVLLALALGWLVRRRREAFAVHG